MNYCILNGKKSTMVKGLMIQSLPSIIKPKIRTRIEEIDGRDGDIVTKLGYSAYDKEMSIGLFGDYDIAEVARYFDQEGEVIFSNELDKKYRFQIIDQINYERLGRFRQAVVKFHVQPFKYPTVNDRVILNPNQDTTDIAQVFNYGNVYSRPTLEISPTDMGISITFGTELRNGDIYNGNTFSILLRPGSAIVDLENMTALDGSGASIMRFVRGDLSKMKLESGLNYVKWNNRYATTIMKNVSRWI